MWLEAERGGAGVRRGACREMARGSPDTQAKVPDCRPGEHRWSWASAALSG
jgi:hypothetical protein